MSFEIKSRKSYLIQDIIYQKMSPQDSTFAQSLIQRVENRADLLSKEKNRAPLSEVPETLALEFFLLAVLSEDRELRSEEVLKNISEEVLENIDESAPPQLVTFAKPDLNQYITREHDYFEIPIVQLAYKERKQRKLAVVRWMLGRVTEHRNKTFFRTETIPAYPYLMGIAYVSKLIEAINESMPTE